MSEPFDFAQSPHRRHNLLTDEWVLVSPQRNQRPWQGQTEAAPSSLSQMYDATCYLCPGNTRMGGEQNPQFKDVFVFANDFPALTPSASQRTASEDPLFQWHAEGGECRVMAYSPRHDQTLAELSQQQLYQVIQGWIEQTRELGRTFDWVQIFENKGEVMGCSMPHPHGQIWAQNHAPTDLMKESQTQQQYYQRHESRLLLDYAQRELEHAERVVVANTDWLVVVPFWAAWPFETLVLPLFPVSRLTELEVAQQTTLAEALQTLLIRYDNMFNCSFPYSMGWHGAPSQGHHPYWQLHAHFFPPLLRSSTVKKFMVGYEMLAEAQRDITPEQAAKVLRELPSEHYKQQSSVDSHAHI